MIEKDPTLLEAELLETLKTNKNKFWSATENQKFLEAYESWRMDNSAISLHIGTKSTEQVRRKIDGLERNMRNKHGIKMSDLLHTDPSREKKLCVKWTESENQMFNDAVREVGRKPYEISNIVGSKTYREVSGKIGHIRR